MQLKIIITQRISQGHFFVTAGPPSLSPKAEPSSSFGCFSTTPRWPILAGWVCSSTTTLSVILFQKVPCSSPGLRDTRFPPSSFCAPRIPQGPGSGARGFSWSIHGLCFKAIAESWIPWWSGKVTELLSHTPPGGKPGGESACPPSVPGRKRESTHLLSTLQPPTPTSYRGCRLSQQV